MFVGCWNRGSELPEGNRLRLEEGMAYKVDCQLLSAEECAYSGFSVSYIIRRS